MKYFQQNPPFEILWSENFNFFFRNSVTKLYRLSLVLYIFSIANKGKGLLLLTVFQLCKKNCLKVIFLELEGVGLVVAPGIRDRRIKFSFHGAGQGGAGWGRGLNLRAGQGQGVYQLIEITCYSRGNNHEKWFSEVSISSRNMRVAICNLVLVSKYESGHMIISISSRQVRARKIVLDLVSKNCTF